MLTIHYEKKFTKSLVLVSISKNLRFTVFGVKYKGTILRVTSPALGSDDLSLDQSGTSIQILPEPNAVM